MPFNQGYGQYAWDSGRWVLDTPERQEALARKQSALANEQAAASTTQLNLQNLQRQAERDRYEFDLWKKNLPTREKADNELLDLNRQTSLLQARQAFKEASDPLSKQYRDEQRQYDLEELRRKRKFGEFSEQARNKILGKMGINTSPQSTSPRYSYSTSTFPWKQNSVTSVG